MYPSNHNKSKEITIEHREDNHVGPKVTKMTFNDMNDVENFFNQADGTDVVPAFATQTQQYTSKKKALVKPGSCPRYRRRSRKDRIEGKPKKQILKDLGPGTTIIVIQKNEETDGSYNSRKIDDFNGLEDEIKKIRGDDKTATAKPQYKSEARVRKRITQSHSSVGSKQQKGKPPIKSPGQEANKGSKIPMIKERRTSVKNKLPSASHRLMAKHTSQKSSSVNSVDSEPKQFNKTQKVQSNSINTKYQSNVPKVVYRIDELIQQKKDALGIRPLDPALDNYKAVLDENKKLKNTVDDQKLRIKKMRQERVLQFKELSKHKEEKKKLEHIIKHDTPKKDRKNRSNYRADSRDNSNASVGNKTDAKSPKHRYGSEYAKPSKSRLVENEVDDYQLEKSDTVKRLKPNIIKPVQQPKIGGRDHAEVISTELLKKSTQDLMQSSFSNLKEIEKIYKMEKYNENFESEINQNIKSKHRQSFNFVDGESPAEGNRTMTKMSMKMSRNNESYKLSPHKEQLRKKIDEDKKRNRGKGAFEINADKLKSQAKEVPDISPVESKLEKGMVKPMKLK
jgi:hypothetical protein